MRTDDGRGSDAINARTGYDIGGFDQATESMALADGKEALTDGKKRFFAATGAGKG